MNKRKAKATFILSIIFFLVFSLLNPINAVFAQKESISDEIEEPGFLIVTEKVEGEMDLIAALNGQVDIESGIIEGLTIISDIQTPKGIMSVKISSDGPIPVENLQAETLGGSLPNIGGICGIDLLPLLEYIDITHLLETLTLNQVISLVENLLEIDLLAVLEHIEIDGLDIDLVLLITLIGDASLIEIIHFVVELLDELGIVLPIDIIAIIDLISEVDLVELISTIDFLELLEMFDVDLDFGDFDFGSIIDLIDLHALLPLLELLGLDELVLNVCLSDVTMMVVEQTVDDITLPNTEITTCYKEECQFAMEDYLPQNNLSSNSLSMNVTTNSTPPSLDIDVEQLEEIVLNIEEDLQTVEELATTLEQLEDILKEQTEEEYIENIMEISELFEQLIHLEDMIDNDEMIEEYYEQIDSNEKSENVNEIEKAEEEIYYEQSYEGASNDLTKENLQTNNDEDNVTSREEIKEAIRYAKMDDLLINYAENISQNYDGLFDHLTEINILLEQVSEIIDTIQINIERSYMIIDELEENDLLNGLTNPHSMNTMIIRLLHDRFGVGEEILLLQKVEEKHEQLILDFNELVERFEHILENKLEIELIKEAALNRIESLIKKIEKIPLKLENETDSLQIIIELLTVKLHDETSNKELEEDTDSSTEVIEDLIEENRDEEQELKQHDENNKQKDEENTDNERDLTKENNNDDEEEQKEYDEISYKEMPIREEENEEEIEKNRPVKNLLKKVNRILKKPW